MITLDVPNAFIQCKLPYWDEDGDRTIMRIEGPMVELLCKLEPGIYEPFVVHESGKPVLHVHIQKAIYCMLHSSLIFYKQWRADLERSGFVINPYDPCVANKMVGGKQFTVTWHVDDVKASHVSQKALDSFADWVQQLYGKYSAVKVTRGKEHDYLAMKLIYTDDKGMIVDMRKYLDDMFEEFPVQLTGKTKSPANDNLFRVMPGASPLTKEKAVVFHSFVMKSMFMSKRARPNVQQVVSYVNIHG